MGWIDDIADEHEDVEILRMDGYDDCVVGLVTQGYGVEWHTYPMPHSVVWEEIAAIRAFLLRVLAPA